MNTKDDHQYCPWQNIPWKSFELIKSNEGLIDPLCWLFFTYAKITLTTSQLIDDDIPGLLIKWYLIDELAN